MKIEQEDSIYHFDETKISKEMFLKVRNYEKNDYLHHETEPAIVEGTYRAWHLNGEYHRIGGPARINDWGEEWFRYGKFHREDGPAECTIHRIGFYLDGIKYTVKEFVHASPYFKTDEERIAFILEYAGSDDIQDDS